MPPAPRKSGLLRPAAVAPRRLSAAGDGPGRTNVIAVPSPENLEGLGRLLDAGVLRVPIQNNYTLDQVGDGLQALGGTHTQGKLGIRVV